MMKVVSFIHLHFFADPFLATWDSPPEPKDPTYQAFKTALKRFIDSRSVIIPKNSRSFYEKFDKRAKDEYKVRHVLKDAADLDIGQNRQLKLMPFQVGTVYSHCIKTCSQNILGGWVQLVV